MKVVVGLFLLSWISYSCAVNVSQCHDIEKPFAGLSQRIKLGNCRKPPCRIRKNTKYRVQMRVTPDRDIEKLVNTIHAYVAGLPLPFPGYDQTDACVNMYAADGITQVGCPLKKGEEYLYKNAIDVLQIYPRLKLVVHWGLTPPDGKDIICFEVPARITNK